MQSGLNAVHPQAGVVGQHDVAGRAYGQRGKVGDVGAGLTARAASVGQHSRRVAVEIDSEELCIILSMKDK